MVIEQDYVDLRIINDEIRLSFSPVVLTGGTGDMAKSVYDANGDSIVDRAEQIERKYECGEAINSGFPVVLIGGKIYLAKANETSHFQKVIGVAKQSGVAGDTIIVVEKGRVYASVVAGEIYWLGATGGLATTPSATGFVQTIGFGDIDGVLFVDLSTPIRR